MEALFLNSIKIAPTVPSSTSLAYKPHWCKKNHLDARKSDKNYRRDSNICHASKRNPINPIISNVEKTEEEMSKCSGGLGILRFLRGKVFLITGGTGFLAKVLIEKILRSEHDVNKIYLLIKATNVKEASRRLEDEVINSGVFKKLQQMHGESYQAFMKNKLVPVVGNITQFNLGIEAGLAEVIANGVNVIVNSAANTTFNERYDVALEINTRGAYNLMSFANKCKKLEVFVQMSTAYVNGQRTGKILEKPFVMGDNITREKVMIENNSACFSKLDVEAEMKLAFESRATHEDNTISFDKKMREMGLERARRYGWQDTYVFTKAMGEMMIHSLREDIPVVIIRPSIIESTYKDPFPGWIEGCRMADPVIILYGKGKLHCFPYDSNVVLDVIPVDMVINATLAAMAKHGSVKFSGMNIYHIGSSVENPLVLHNVFTFIFDHFSSFPYFNSIGEKIKVSEVIPVRSIDDFTVEMLEHFVKNRKANKQKHPKQLDAAYTPLLEKVKHLAKIYEPYTFYAGRFDNSNTKKLMAGMSEEERITFSFDVGNIDWREYFCNIHIPGLRRYVMKEMMMRR